MSTSSRRPRRYRALALCAATIAVAGCSSSLPASVSSAPVLSVVTGLYPLEQAAQLIGGDKVAVDDVVPPGTDPLTYSPTPDQRRAIHAAGLVVEAGRGLQPVFETAAGTGATVLPLAQRLGVTDPYVWLDPGTMQKAVAVLAGAMEAADPPAAALFRQNATSLDAQVSSLGIDYSSTLAACAGTTLVTPDDALTAMAGAYERTDLVVASDPAPTAARVQAVVRAVHDASAALIVSEPWVDDSGVEVVAAAAGRGLHDIDTLAGPPAGGWPAGSTYFALMESNLATLTSGLGCSNEQQ